MIPMTHTFWHKGEYIKQKYIIFYIHLLYSKYIENDCIDFSYSFSNKIYKVHLELFE